MNRFFRFCAIAAALSGCATTEPVWRMDYNMPAAGTPTAMRYGTYSADDGATRRMAVLLPLTGANAETGRAIRASVEMATLAAAPDNLSVSFHDTAADIDGAINAALYTNPEIIIGPLFANDARALRGAKPADIPVLSFTSDATATGNGVMTMALMPVNSIEAIVREMTADQIHSQIVFAPDNSSGRLMAAAARRAGEIYGVPVTGIFLYRERDTDSIKSAAERASMNAARIAANNKARAILSDILTNEALTSAERTSILKQLETLTRDEVLGTLPYDAVLFLGSGDDTKSAASFLRYYGVNDKDAHFYGTAMWDGSDIASDFTMSGAKFATLPPTNMEFAAVYEQLTGNAPTRIADFGYDAANMAMGMLYSGRPAAAYLMDPSGYIGTDGLVRLRPNGDSERGLRIMRLDASGTPVPVRDAPANFMTPLYNIEQRQLTPATEMPLATAGVRPTDHIRIPDRLRSKYRTSTYGATTTAPASPVQSAVMTILPEDDADIVTTPDFQPVKLDTVRRTYIDSIEIEE